MIKLINEYTDRKNIKHTVTHRILCYDDPACREQILEEIRRIMENQMKKRSINTSS